MPRTLPDGPSGRSATVAALRGDLEWGTTPRLVQSAAERFGDREAVVDGDVRLSFADLAGAGRRAARAFLATRREPGDPVAFCAPNVSERPARVRTLPLAGVLR